MRTRLWVTALLIAAAGCGPTSKEKALEKQVTVAERRYFEIKDRELKIMGEREAAEKALEGAQAALAGETARANRLATKLNTTEMELSDAELLIMALQKELKTTREALVKATTEAERNAYLKLKQELEARRAAAQKELAAKAAVRKRDQAAWTVALQTVLPAAKQLLNTDEEFKRYVAGFATDRPLFNIRVHPAFTTDARPAVAAAAGRLRAALKPLVADGVKLARQQGHTPSFPPEPSLRFYDPNAADPDDSIGKIVAEWEWTSEWLSWRE